MVVKQFGKLNNNKCDGKHIMKLYPDNNCAKTAYAWAGSRRSVKQVNSDWAGGSIWVVHCQSESE